MKDRIIGAIISTLIIGAAIWAWNQERWNSKIEGRIGDSSLLSQLENLHSRIERLEGELMPVLIEYEVRKRVAENHISATEKPLEETIFEARKDISEFMREQRTFYSPPIPKDKRN